MITISKYDLILDCLPYEAYLVSLLLSTKNDIYMIHDLSVYFVPIMTLSMH